MNDLLPKIEELIPITNKKNTFYDCGFNTNFYELSFAQKLQIVNDLVRQSIKPTSRPNPQDHVETLIGNCHTAALASIEYLKYLNLGKNHRYVMGRIKNYELDDFTTTHALVLLEDDDNNTYQFDATPYVGYYYGSVLKLDKEKIYLDYTNITNEILELLDKIKELMILDYNGHINKKNILYYKNILLECEKYSILSGYTSHCYKLLSKYCENKYEKNEYIKKIILLNPYDENNINNAAVKRKTILKRINKWKEELDDIIGGHDLKRQLILAQNILQEMKFIDNNYEKYVEINNKKERLSHITPRFLMEEKLNAIMIKPSSYFFNKECYIENEIAKNSDIFGKYYIDLSNKTIMGLKPMLFSHPLGEEYIRSMTGPSEIFLVNKSAEDLHNIKVNLREKLGKDLYGKELIWSDGKPILWHPFVTNYVHTADHYSESSLHYLIGFPEHQVMTRFMYPNKKLERKK